MSNGIVGRKVRLSDDFKRYLSKTKDGREHLEEFGDCIGIVDSYMHWPNSNEYGPEVDVYWQPSNLHYLYLPEYLIVVE